MNLIYAQHNKLGVQKRRNDGLKNKKSQISVTSRKALPILSMCVYYKMGGPLARQL